MLIAQSPREISEFHTIREELPKKLDSVGMDDQQSTEDTSEHSKCYQAF